MNNNNNNNKRKRRISSSFLFVITVVVISFSFLIVASSASSVLDVDDDHLDGDGTPMASQLVGLLSSNLAVSSSLSTTAQTTTNIADDRKDVAVDVQEEQVIDNDGSGILSPSTNTNTIITAVARNDSKNNSHHNNLLMAEWAYYLSACYLIVITCLGLVMNFTIVVVILSDHRPVFKTTISTFHY